MLLFIPMGIVVNLTLKIKITMFNKLRQTFMTYHRKPFLSTLITVTVFFLVIIINSLYSYELSYMESIGINHLWNYYAIHNGMLIVINIKFILFVIVVITYLYLKRYP